MNEATATLLDDLEACTGDTLVDRIHTARAATDAAEAMDDLSTAMVRFRQHLALLRVLQRRFPNLVELSLWP